MAEEKNQTQIERELNEKLAENPPVAGLHADTNAVQHSVNSLANSYPENDDAEVVEARLKEDEKSDEDEKPKSKKKSK